MLENLMCIMQDYQIKKKWLDFTLNNTLTIWNSMLVKICRINSILMELINPPLCLIKTQHWTLWKIDKHLRLDNPLIVLHLMDCSITVKYQQERLLMLLVYCWMDKLILLLILEEVSIMLRSQKRVGSVMWMILFLPFFNYC